MSMALNILRALRPLVAQPSLGHLTPERHRAVRGVDGHDDNRFLRDRDSVRSFARSCEDRRGEWDHVVFGCLVHISDVGEYKLLELTYHTCRHIQWGMQSQDLVDNCVKVRQPIRHLLPCRICTSEL
jgi:hypothetical protein